MNKEIEMQVTRKEFVDAFKQDVTIQVSRAEYEALQAERDEAVRQRDKFYGEANIERENAATYRTILEMCVAATGGEIPFGDLPGTIEALRRDAERYRWIIRNCELTDEHGSIEDETQLDAAINMPKGEE